jgi:hypothetical protein
VFFQYLHFLINCQPLSFHWHSQCQQKFTYKKTTGRSQGRVDKLCWYTGRTDTTWTPYISKKINCIPKVSTASVAALSSLIHCQVRDTNTRKPDSVYVLFCPLSSVRVRSRGFPQMGGYYLLKYNGGDLGIRIFVLYWRCLLIRVSVIKCCFFMWNFFKFICSPFGYNDGILKRMYQITAFHILTLGHTVNWKYI